MVRDRTGSASVPEAVESALAGASRRHVGLVIAASAGATTTVRGAGRTGPDGSAPTEHTLFQIGSVTKVFTALALADAVVRGDVALDTPLAACLRNPPESPRGARIALEHLATHTSGLPRLPRGLWASALRHRLDPYRDFDVDQLLAAVAAARVRSDPGTRYRYSNFGAGLLGHVLGERAGLPYGRLVAERVTIPLGLSDTVTWLSPDQQQRRAVGHDARGRPVPDWNLGALAGAGALYSSATDLLRLLGGHLDPGATSVPEVLRLVQRPRHRVNARLSMGLGWHLVTLRRGGPPALFHNGGTGGFRSFVACVPAADVAVVVLANGTRAPDGIGVRLLRTLCALGGQ